MLTLVIERTLDPTTWLIVTGWLATAYLRHLDPFPATPARSRAPIRRCWPELNTGQLLSLLRDKYLVDAVGHNQVERLHAHAEAGLDDVDALLRSRDTWVV